MAILAKKKVQSVSGSRPRDHLDIFVSRGKIVLHMIFWLFLMALIARVFILPYFGADQAQANPDSLVALVGDEVFLAIGVLIVGLIVMYMSALVVRARIKGPSYRISRDGLWLYNIEDFFIPKKMIRSVCPLYRQGIMSTLVLELRDRQVLLDLEQRAPRLSSVTCNPDKGTLSIELTGVKGKKDFARTLARVAYSSH